MARFWIAEIETRPPTPEEIRAEEDEWGGPPTDTPPTGWTDIGWLDDTGITYEED